MHLRQTGRVPASLWWLFALIAPFAYAVVMGRRHRGFTRQPCLVVGARPGAVRLPSEGRGRTCGSQAGSLVHIPFAVLLCGAIGVIVAAADGPWWLVLPAVALDFLEGRVLWVIAGESARTRRAVRLLFRIAVAKFAAYGAGVVALVWAAWKLLLTWPFGSFA